MRAWLACSARSNWLVGTSVGSRRGRRMGYSPSRKAFSARVSRWSGSAGKLYFILGVAAFFACSLASMRALCTPRRAATIAASGEDAGPDDGSGDCARSGVAARELRPTTRAWQRRRRRYIEHLWKIHFNYARITRLNLDLARLNALQIRRVLDAKIERLGRIESAALKRHPNAAMGAVRARVGLRIYINEDVFVGFNPNMRILPIKHDWNLIVFVCIYHHKSTVGFAARGAGAQQVFAGGEFDRAELPGDRFAVDFQARGGRKDLELNRGRLNLGFLPTRCLVRGRVAGLRLPLARELNSFLDDTRRGLFDLRDLAHRPGILKALKRRAGDGARLRRDAARNLAGLKSGELKVGECLRRVNPALGCVLGEHHPGVGRRVLEGLLRQGG